MNAEGLMIGNYLLNDKIVVRIDARSIFDMFIDNPKYTPIKITKSWLRNLGFKNITDHKFESYPLHNYWVNNGVCLFYNESDERDVYLLGYAEMRMGIYYAVGTKWTEYVHDVQNFYFITTRELL
jgi:hypothetical protein